jgi:uncharacterized protein with GYD domain
MAVKNAKAKGTRAEHRCMKQLEDRGYRCTRAAASLGEWDVIAVGPSDTKLIQVKCNRRPGSEEMGRLHAFQCGDLVSKEVWVYKDGRPREPIIEILNQRGSHESGDSG